MITAVAALAVLGAALGVAFTADTGTTQAAVGTAAGAGALVYTPGEPLTALPASTTFFDSGNAAGDAPGWSVAAGTAGSVTDAGDIAIVDARSTQTGGASNVIVTIYITNLAPLQKNYSSYAFPLEIRRSSGFSSGSFTSWGSVLHAEYLTHTSGFLSFSLPVAANDERIYALSMPQGGSYYATSATDDATSDLAPTFFITASPA